MLTVASFPRRDTKQEVPEMSPAPTLEFPEINTRIQFAIDCTKQRFNAVFFAVCLAKIKSAFEMNKIQIGSVTCYIYKIQPVRSFGEGQPLRWRIFAFLGQWLSAAVLFLLSLRVISTMIEDLRSISKVQNRHFVFAAILAFFWSLWTVLPDWFRRLIHRSIKRKKEQRKVSCEARKT